MSPEKRMMYGRAKRENAAAVCAVWGHRPLYGYAFDRNATSGQPRRYFIFGNGCVKSQARLLAAILVGRPLEADEAVHHVNGDRTDDRIENFQVVPSAAHQQFHAFVDNGKPPPPELARMFRFVRGRGEATLIAS